VKRPSCFMAVVWAASMVCLWVTHATAGEEFRSSETRTFEVGNTPDISMETVSGDVSYMASEGTAATVTIETTVRAKSQEEADRIRDEVKIIVDGGDGFLTARVDYPDDFQHWLKHLFGPQRSISVSFRVRGPRGADGVLTSVSGDVEVESVDGRMELRSVSGDITARQLAGALRANSTSGSIHAVDCAGPIAAQSVSGDQRLESCGSGLKAHSVSGSIAARSIKGETDVEAVSGDVTIDDAEATVTAGTISGEIRIDQRAGGFDVHTTSGDITVRSSATTSPMVARSTSGEINVTVDPTAIGDVILETSSGDIQADLAMKIRQHTRHRLVGRVGDGEHQLKITTVSGEIVLGEL